MPPTLTRSVSALRTRCALLTLLLPDDVAFSHLTAAALWGLPLPDHLRTVSVIDIIRPTGSPRIRRTDVVTHRGGEHRRIVDVDGLRITSPMDTFIDLASLSERGLEVADLVDVGRALLAMTDACTIGTLTATGDRRPRVRGRPLVEAALERLATRAQ